MRRENIKRVANELRKKAQQLREETEEWAAGRLSEQPLATHSRHVERAK